MAIDGAGEPLEKVSARAGARSERGICFEAIVVAIEAGELLDVLKHTNQGRYPGQRVLMVWLADQRGPAGPVGCPAPIRPGERAEGSAHQHSPHQW